jgi:hypothetical protein
MQAGLAVVFLRYVAEQTQYLALLIDGNGAVPFGCEIEPPDLALSNAPTAATDAALIAFSFANVVTAAKASPLGPEPGRMSGRRPRKASLNFMSRLAEMHSRPGPWQPE